MIIILKGSVNTKVNNISTGKYKMCIKFIGWERKNVKESTCLDIHIFIYFLYIGFNSEQKWIGEEHGHDDELLFCHSKKWYFFGVTFVFHYNSNVLHSSIYFSEIFDDHFMKKKHFSVTSASIGCCSSISSFTIFVKFTWTI